MRNETARLIEALREAVDVARTAGVRLEVSHLKTGTQESWPLLDEALEILRGARAEGLDVAADRYPYVSGYTDLDIVFPAWAEEGGREAVLKRLKDASVRGRLRDELASRPAGYWGGIVIGSTHHPDNARFRGVPLSEVAAQLGLEPVDAVLYLAESDEVRTGAFFFGMSEDNMRRILAEEYVMLGSDASLRALTGPLSRDFPHPRTYGSFPRFLRMALDGETVPLPEAVRKITSLPAAHFGLEGRGVLAEGSRADIVVFDPETVRDTATYASPHQLPRGIEHVIVNGVLTVRDGALTGSRAGRFL
jgi:N-acyl-D-amino-acid deacylase